MLRVLARLTVAAVVLALVLARTDAAAVRDALASASPWSVIAAAAASFAANAIIAFRLQRMLAGQGVPTGPLQTFAINLAAFFYNLFLPAGGVGVAAVRLQRLSRQASGRFTAALTAMVCDRVAAVASLALVGLLGLLADPHPKPSVALLVLIGGATAIPFLLVPRVVPQRIRQGVREWHAAGTGTWWAAVLGRMRHAVGAIARLPPSTIISVIMLSLLAQVPGVMVFSTLARGLGLEVPWTTMVWVRSVVVLLTILPVSIGGLGVREGALLFLLRPFGVAAHDALALSLLVFAVTILAPGLVGGFVEAWRWFRS